MNIITSTEAVKNALSGVLSSVVREDAIVEVMHIQDAIVLDLALSLARGLAEDKSDAANLGRMALLRDALDDALKSESRPRKVKTPQVSW